MEVLRNAVEMYRERVPQASYNVPRGRWGGESEMAKRARPARTREKLGDLKRKSLEVRVRVKETGRVGISLSQRDFGAHRATFGA